MEEKKARIEELKAKEELSEPQIRLKCEWCEKLYTKEEQAELEALEAEEVIEEAKEELPAEEPEA